MIPPTTNNRASAHIYLKMAVATAVFIKTPGSAGCFDTRKRFCVPFIWRANIAFGMHPRQSCGASSLDWERETLPIEGSNKGPVTRRGLLLPNLHKSSFPSRIFPAVIFFAADIRNILSPFAAMNISIAPALDFRIPFACKIKTIRTGRL